MPYVPADIAAQAPAGSGGSAPPTGFYEAVITNDPGGPGSSPWVTRHVVTFAGFSTSTLVTWAYNDDGEMNPKAAALPTPAEQEKKLINQAKFTAGIGISCGLDPEEMKANGYSDTDFDGATCYIQWHNGADFDPPQKYGELTQFISAEVFDDMAANNRGPTVPYRTNRAAPAAGAAGAGPGPRAGGAPGRPPVRQQAQAPAQQATQPAAAAATPPAPPTGRRPPPPAARGVVK